MTCMTVWRSVLRFDATSIAIFPHYFIFAFKNFCRSRALIARRIYFLKKTLSPGRESGFVVFFAFDIVPFAAARFTGVGVPCMAATMKKRGTRTKMTMSTRTIAQLITSGTNSSAIMYLLPVPELSTITQRGYTSSWTIIEP